MFSKVHSLLLSCLIFQVLFCWTAEYSHEQLNKKVKVTLYFESLCPACHAFITTQLVPTWNLLRDYMVLELVPYGNAEREFVNGHWKFTCQHGELECKENLIDSCAAQLLQNKNTNKIVRFIHCMILNKNISLPMKRNLCMRQEDMPIDQIKSCVESSDAEKLMLYMAEKTEGVSPQMDGVPTIEINGVHDETEQNEIYKNFKIVICKHLGDPQPGVCMNLLNRN